MFLLCEWDNVWLINFDLDRYIPMLISRMIISLKKVASSRETHLAIDTMGAVPTVPQGDYTSRQAEAIRLSTFQ